MPFKVVNGLEEHHDAENVHCVHLRLVGLTAGDRCRLHLLSQIYYYCISKCLPGQNSVVKTAVS